MNPGQQARGGVSRCEKPKNCARLKAGNVQQQQRATFNSPRRRLARAAAFSLFGFAASVACIKGIKMLLYEKRAEWEPEREREREGAGERVRMRRWEGCQTAWVLVVLPGVGGQPLIPDNDTIITPSICQTNGRTGRPTEMKDRWLVHNSQFFLSLSLFLLYFVWKT